MKNNETLEGLMAQYDFNEADLLENAEMMGFNADHKMDHLEREPLRKRLAKAVLNDPKRVLKRLPVEDLMLLRILKDAEPGMGMQSHYTTQMMSMSMLGLAVEEPTDDEEPMQIISISEDFKQAISPYIDEVLDDFEVKMRLHVEQFLVGALNIYGVLTKSELKAILKECLELTDDGSGMFNHIYPNSIALQMQKVDGYCGDDEDFFLSPFVHDFGYILKERKKRKEIATLKHFDRYVLQKAGGMPVPFIPNVAVDELLETLQNNMGLTEDEAYFEAFLLWRMVQEEDVEETDIIQTLMGSNSEAGFKDIKEVNEVMQVVIDYLNHAPRWIFRGHSPADIQKPLTSAPTIIPEPNMRRMGYTQEAAQRIADEAWANRTKVGRNEPCPCGSGKKYKNCCGRL